MTLTFKIKTKIVDRVYKALLVWPPHFQPHFTQDSFLFSLL